MHKDTATQQVVVFKDFDKKIEKRLPNNTKQESNSISNTM